MRERILAAGGAIVTEYLPRASYSGDHFVQRNRLQAALGRVLIPVEWSRRSATAHTVRFASELERPIACLRLPHWPAERVQLEQALGSRPACSSLYRASRRDSTASCAKALAGPSPREGPALALWRGWLNMLKGAIFSLHDVLVKQGTIDGTLFGETVKLLRYLKGRGVEPAFISNHDWTVSSEGTKRPFRSLLEEKLGPISYFIGGRDGMPYKPRADSTAFILAAKGWDRREVLYVGNTQDDMKTAANGRLMFVNAMWHGVASPYGFQFESPLDVARFVDSLCLGLEGWFWALEQGPLRVYALAPFTTLSAKYAQAHAYSENAKATSKHGTGDANFWGRLLAARVYFSGLADEIDYITAYPGHSPTSNPTVIADALNILGQSLRKNYLPDLIMRHSKAVKSQTARASGGSVGIDNQLNTIRLNAAPRRGVGGAPYKAPPVKTGKTVLLVDDIRTEGNSFEAGRAFIGATGAATICLSWLKTINSDYRAVFPSFGSFNPYGAISITAPVQSHAYWYGSAISSHAAPTDLAEVYQGYFKWEWPTGL